MNRLELLYNHYKETLDLLSSARTNRNRCYIILCVLEAVSLLLVYAPDSTYELIESGISEHFGLSLRMGNTVIESLIWTLILYATIRYTQETLYIERSYIYVGRIEKELSHDVLISRENDSYFENYPVVLNIIDLFYKMRSPILFISINSVHIHREWLSLSQVNLALVYDSIIFAVSFLVAWFYFFEVHSKITGWCKAHLPFVASLAQILRHILKEV